MNTERVFTAFNKEGKEILLYVKDKDTYIDLLSNNNEIYNKDNIDLTSLKPISNSLDLRKYMLRYSIKNKYKKDREKLIETNNYLLGLKVIVSDYQKWYTGDNIFEMEKHHRWQENPKEYDLYRFIKKEEISFDTTLNIYKNLSKEDFFGYEENNEPEKLYHMDNFGNGKEYIITKSNYDLSKMTKKAYLDKKTINEIGYKLRKKII
ncbi:MAG: hypothetical protein IJD92_02215 [Bacilli bacterium]|nr:hypothetical protein [Bacilli bacterium]